MKCRWQEYLKQLFGLETTPYLRSSCKCDLRCKGDGKSQGFAFVTVPSHVAGELLNLNGIEFYGQPLVIEESKTEEGGKKPTQNKGGKGGGKGNGQKGGQKGYRGYKKNYNKYDMPKLDADQKWEICDGGANLTNPKFHQNKELVVRRAQEAGVSKIVVTGLKLNGCITAETMSSGYTNLYAAVGVHPHFVKDDWNDKAAEKIAELAKKDNVVAIGEVGLDYCRCFSEKEQMKKAFEAQVKIAADVGKALLVHDREASEDVIAILGQVNLKAPVVIYCMTGPTEQIKAYLNHGYYIGITGFICKESYGKHIREAIKNRDLPLTKIIVHSNAPYMVPNMPPAEIDQVSKSLIELCFRDANEPCTLQVVVRQIATLLDMAPKDVAQQLLKNAEAVYKFPQK
jgi:TatD DNase family protein